MVFRPFAGKNAQVQSGKTYIVTPNQSNPTSLLSETPYQPTGSLGTLSVTDESMLSQIVGTEGEVAFSVTYNGSDTIELVRSDTNETLGTMTSSGNEVFTFKLSVKSDSIGRVMLAARTKNEISNSVTVHFFEPLTSDRLGYTDSLCAEIQNIEAQYLNASGYVPSDKVAEAITSVADYVRTKYLAGAISDYGITEDSVSFRDAASGLWMLFTPVTEGNLSSDKTPSKITTVQPYAMTTSGDHLDPGNVQHIASFLVSALEVPSTEYLESVATPDTIAYIGQNEMMIWFGHGSWLTGFGAGFRNRPVLITGLVDSGYYLAHVADIIAGRIGKDVDSGRIFIMPEFIDKYCNNISGSLIWLCACHSAQNDLLAQSFLNHGAAAVIGFDETVKEDYAINIMADTLDNLLTGVTLGNSLTLAMASVGFA